MEWLSQLNSADSHSITWWQMALRGGLVFLAGLVLVRLSGKRTFGRTTSFDIVVTVMLGSILSRAVTGNAKLLPTLGASAAITLLHFALGKLALHSRSAGHLVKGLETQLVKEGQIQWGAMRQSNMTEHDLAEAARLKGVLDVKEVQNAFLERSGTVTVFKKATPGG